MKILCLSLLLMFLPLTVLAGETIINSEIEVDVSGKDAADARTQAMAKAEIDALAALLDKLVQTENTKAMIASIDSRKLGKMVKGKEVLDEKISGNRYQARLLVNFDGDEISDLISKLTENDAARIGGVNSFLIVPVYQENGKTTIWEETNPWFATWKNVALENNLGDIIVPYGDTKDYSFVDADRVESATYPSLAQMAIRYGVTDIVIVKAKLEVKPDLVLSVIKRRISRGNNEVNSLSYRADPQETRDLLLARAARDIIFGLQNKKTEELSTIRTVRGGEHNKIMMLASISTMPSWTQLRKKLSDLPMVDRIELLALSAKQVDMIVHYRGEADSLERAIVSRNLRLVKNKDYWVVSRD